MNREIGEVFDFCGVKLKVVKRDTFDCNSCFFVKRGLPCGAYPLTQYFGQCGRYAREDETSIKFIELES